MDTEAASKNGRRYYWLKLPKSYFSHLEQKKMRRHEHGKDMQIVYLRMMLLSIDKGGYIYYQGVYDTLEEELAEEFDEPMEIIKETLEYLKLNNMIAIDDNSDCFLPESLELTGSECSSAERVRKHRNSQRALQCNSDVTDSNVNVTPCNVEKELEIEKESEEKRINYQQIADMYNDTCVSLPRISRLSDSRKKAIKARLNTYSLEDFQKLFKMAESSGFLKGKNGRNWSANFDWLIKDSNMAKVFDGNYSDNRYALKNAAIGDCEEDIYAGNGYQKTKEEIEAGIYEIVNSRISEEVLERYHEKIHELICMCFPFECFTKEQIDYMRYQWKIEPLHKQDVLVVPSPDTYDFYDMKLGIVD